MFLHLGQDFVVAEKDIVGVFDMESATIARKTRDFLKRAEKEGRVITPVDKLPKSFVVCMGRAGRVVYLSTLSPAALNRRLSYIDAIKSKNCDGICAGLDFSI